MKLTIDHAIPVVTALVQARIPTNLLASPGVGKSDLIRAVAKQLNLLLIDVRLSTCDPCDLTGLPSIENGRSIWAPNKCFPLADFDTVPEGYSGWMLFLDEITNAPMSVQAAAYKLILDREVGEHKLHDAVFITSAGNLVSDQAAVTEEMSTALKSRMAHINIMVSADAWLAWAETPEVDIDFRITSYIRFKKEDGLYKFNPNSAADTYPCPRTWQMADCFMKQVGSDSPLLYKGLSAIISDGAASDFKAFTDYFSDLPTLEQIIKDPENARMPTERGPCYALSGLVSKNINKDNLDALVIYIKRMPSEFQGATFIPAFKRNPSLVANATIREWASKYAKNTFQ